jgi:hypothetical protein
VLLFRFFSFCPSAGIERKRFEWRAVYVVISKNSIYLTCTLNELVKTIFSSSSVLLVSEQPSDI